MIPLGKLAPTCMILLQNAKRSIRTSCSADHLGAIVDILGVPNSAPVLWDSPRR